MKIKPWIPALLPLLVLGVAQAQTLVVDAAQQAALGVQVVALQPATDALLLASARVTVPPNAQALVSAPYAGQITRLLVGVGDSVRAGQALAAFVSPALGEARRLLQEARLELQSANAALQRDQALLAEGVIAPVRLQSSRARQQAAQTLVQAREAERHASGLGAEADANGYASATLVAPRAGVVLQSLATVGQRVEAGAALFRIADTNQLQLELQLSNDKAARIQAGDTVEIAARQALARITAVSRALDDGQSASARALVHQRGNLQLGEALPVTVHSPATRGSTGAPAWAVPARALSQWQGSPTLFVANAKGFVPQPVRIVTSDDDLAVVQAVAPGTLAPTSRVALTGIAALRALLQKGE